MNDKILDHYLQFGLFTNPGCYKDILINSLPNKIEEIGFLVKKQIIHRVTLKNGNTGSNKNMRYGDMTKVPWYRQCEDDNLPTATAMLAELYRRDNGGFIIDRAEKDRLVVTCRFVSILIASILKSKGIPTRVRSGFAPYFEGFGNKSVDHWINQCWDKNKNSWITIDVDGSLEPYLKFNHSLMNSEIIYLHAPEMIKFSNFDKLAEEELKKIDNLALLMQKPDENFDELQKIWETNREFRLLRGALL